MIIAEVLVENWTVLVFLAITLGISAGAFMYFKKINTTQEVEFLFGSILAPIAGAIFLVIALSGFAYMGGKMIEGFSRVKSLEEAVEAKPLFEEKDQSQQKKEVSEELNEDEARRGETGSKDQITAGAAGRTFNNTQREALREGGVEATTEESAEIEVSRGPDPWKVEEIVYEGGWGLEQSSEREINSEQASKKEDQN